MIKLGICLAWISWPCKGGCTCCASGQVVAGSLPRNGRLHRIQAHRRRIAVNSRSFPWCPWRVVYISCKAPGYTGLALLVENGFLSQLCRGRAHRACLLKASCMHERHVRKSDPQVRKPNISIQFHTYHWSNLFVMFPSKHNQESFTKFAKNSCSKHCDFDWTCVRICIADRHDRLRWNMPSFVLHLSFAFCSNLVQFRVDTFPRRLAWLIVHWPINSLVIDMRVCVCVRMLPAT